MNNEEYFLYPANTVYGQETIDTGLAISFSESDLSFDKKLERWVLLNIHLVFSCICFHFS